MLVTHGNMMRERGFTLIEALVVLSIVAIVVAVGVPNLSHLIGTMNARSATFDLVADLAMARSEAIKRNANIGVQPLVGNDWSQGWRVWDGVNTLRQRSALPSGLTVTSSSNTLQFRPNGRLGADDTATANASWSITSSNATPRCVVITPTGAARSIVKVGGC
jgi:type IV fimbrial biogenesis protein FimT